MPEASMRRQDQDIEAAVVRPCSCQQGDTTGEPADVRDDYADSALLEDRRPVVEADRVVLTRRPEDGPSCSTDIGEPADPFLQTVVGVAYEGRVEPDSRHHRVGLVAGLENVDASIDPVEGDIERQVGMERNLEVAREKISGTGRYDPERDSGAGKRSRARCHRPVAANGDDQRRPVLHSRTCLTRSRIGLGRLGPAHLHGGAGGIDFPHAGVDEGTEGIDVGNLDWVDDHDDSHPAFRRRRSARSVGHGPCSSPSVASAGAGRRILANTGQAVQSRHFMLSTVGDCAGTPRRWAPARRRRRPRRSGADSDRCSARATRARSRPESLRQTIRGRRSPART